VTSPIVRMYETEKQARDAVSNLKQEGFPEDCIFLVTPGVDGGGESAKPAPGEAVPEEPTGAEAASRGGGSRQTTAMAIMAGHVLRSDAKVYAEGIESGRSLVAVSAPFGYGLLATRVLDSFGPVDTGIQLPERRSLAWDEAAPLSSALQLRTVLRNRPAPFSSVVGLPTTASGLSALASLFGGLASSDFALFGRSALSENPAPLSSMFGLRTISKRTGPLVSRFGLPLLSQNPAPMSSKLGLSLLTEGPLRSHAAPLSAVLGLPVISRGRSFLSRLFGELGSSRFALFGRNPLSRNPAPLSSLLGLKTRSGETGELWRSSFGLPLLSASQSAYSLGLPLLSSNPAPLSSLLGLRVLSRYQ